MIKEAARRWLCVFGWRVGFLFVWPCVWVWVDISPGPDALLGRSNEAGIYSLLLHSFFSESCSPEEIIGGQIVNKAQQTLECPVGSVGGHILLYIVYLQHHGYKSCLCPLSSLSKQNKYQHVLVAYTQVYSHLT